MGTWILGTHKKFFVFNLHVSFAVDRDNIIPIYWLFDSGKKIGFRGLIYMHRYQSNTIARIRTDYVHEQQARYRTAIADQMNSIDLDVGVKKNYAIFRDVLAKIK